MKSNLKNPTHQRSNNSHKYKKINGKYIIACKDVKSILVHIQEGVYVYQIDLGVKG